MGATAPAELLPRLGCVPTTVSLVHSQSQGALKPVLVLLCTGRSGYQLPLEMWPRKSEEDGGGKQAAYGPLGEGGTGH